MTFTELGALSLVAFVYDSNVPVPKKKPREAVTIRMGVDGLAHVDQFAAEEDRTRSDMARILIGEAVAARLAKKGSR